MFIGALFPTAFAACKPRRGMRPVAEQAGRLVVRLAPTVRPNAAALPSGQAAIAPETQSVLAAASDYARSRFVELQMAVEPRLVAQVDAATYRSCLRELLLAAIDRACSGILVTAMRQAGGVEVAMLDDGTASAEARPDWPMPHGLGPALPQGATLTADYQPKRGTTILLRMPQPEWLPVPPCADASDGTAAAADA